MALLQAGPEHLVGGAGDDPGEGHAGSEELELEIRDGRYRHSGGDHGQRHHLRSRLPPSILGFRRKPGDKWFPELTFWKETVFRNRMNSARTMVGVTAIFAIW